MAQDDGWTTLDGQRAHVPRRLLVRLLGPVCVTLDGNPVPELATPRVQRLLARLALGPVRGAVLRREHVAYELWPDSTERQARANLRKLVHDLRRTLPDPDDFLDADHDTLRWRPAAPAWFDVTAFTEALNRGDPAAAVGHYGGDLLPACYDDWVLAERDRLRRLAVDALAHLASTAEEACRDADAVGYAWQLLGIDPLHEPAYRWLMVALARQGKRSEALRVYQRCVQSLRRQLGVPPSAATVEVYQRLCAAHPGPEPTGTGPRLVGRDAQWRRVHAVWHAAARGGAHVLLVTGEPGIGKTRLVEELARRVAAEGHLVARTRAYEAAGRSPWAPVVDWLRSDSIRAGLGRLDPVRLTELARLLPELRARYPDLPEAPPATDPIRRWQLLDAVCRGLLATGKPVLLVVDDLQWCDPDTLELCSFLLHCAPSAPVLVAATARDDEIDDDHPLALLPQRLASTGGLSVVALDRLGPEPTAEVAALVHGMSLDSDTAGRLWRETEGNPLFVIEAVRAGFADDDRPWRQGLTPTVHATIKTRMRRLSPAARHLAEVAATIGREFSSVILASATGTTEDDIADTLDELWHRHIVRAHGAAHDFSHDKLREVTLASISPARRRKLHRAVAAALEQHHADDLGPVSARLAHHYEAAGLDARAVDAYERAAAHAYRVFALDDAIAALHQALRLLDRSMRGAARDEIELRLHSALGVPLVARRGYGAPDAVRSYQRALTLHRRLGRSPSPAVLRGLALHSVMVCEFDQAAALGTELISAGPVDHTALVEGLYVRGVTAFWRGDYAAAEGYLTRAVQEYHPEEAPQHLLRYAQDPKGVCLCRLALNHLFRTGESAAGDTMRAALRFVTELDHPMTTGYVHAYDAILAALAPDRYNLPASVTALEAATSPMRIGYFATMARMLAGWRDVLGGDLGGIATMREITDLWRAEQQLHLTLGLSFLARGHLRAGDTAAGRAATAEALDRTEGAGPRYLLAELLRVDAELLALSGDRTEADAACRRAIDVARQQRSPWLHSRAQVTLEQLSTAGSGRGTLV